MTKKPSFSNKAFGLYGKNFSRIRKNLQYGYQEGAVLTPFGMAWVYTQWGTNGLRAYSTVEIVKKWSGASPKVGREKFQ